jgi:hypothetical protein
MARVAAPHPEVRTLLPEPLYLALARNV